jgi:hypothetical protein
LYVFMLRKYVFECVRRILITTMLNVQEKLS